VGRMASSKTGPRPVCCRIFGGNLGRKLERVERPRERIGVEGSSRSVRSGGMKRFQLWEMISSCFELAIIWCLEWIRTLETA